MYGLENKDLMNTVLSMDRFCEIMALAFRAIAILQGPSINNVTVGGGRGPLQQILTLAKVSEMLTVFCEQLPNLEGKGVIEVKTNLVYSKTRNHHSNKNMV